MISDVRGMSPVALTNEILRNVEPVKSRLRIHQSFSRTFFVFLSKICKFECNTTSDWLNRTV